MRPLCIILFALFFLGSISSSISQDFVTDIQQALEYYDAGQYAEAAELFSKWIPIISEEYGENDTSVYVKLLAWAGNSYYSSGNYQQAEPLMIQAMNIHKEQMGEHHPFFAIRLHSLAQLYQAMGRYKEAEPLMLEASMIMMESFGENHSNYGASLSNLAQLYQAMGRYEEAEQLMILAMNIDYNQLGDQHTDFAVDLNNLAQIYRIIGRYEEAETLMIRALHIDKEQLGEQHPDYALDLNNLAQLYQDMGRYEEAEPLMIQALSIDKENLGERHPAYAGGLNNLALLYLAMGRYEDAETLMILAMNIDKEQLGENHPDYARDLNNLAQLYQAVGWYEEAEPLMKEACRICKETFGEDHTDYGTSIGNLALIYEALGRYEEAEPLMIQAKDITKKQLGEQHPDYAGGLNNLAALYLAMGRYEAAEPLMIQACNIFKESVGKNHPLAGISMHNLAALYQALDRYQEAEPLMIQAFEILSNQMKTNTGFLSEKETELFVKKFSYDLDVYHSFNAQYSKMSPSAAQFDFNIELNRKGILLRSAQGVRTRILESGDSLLVHDFNRLITLRKKMDKLNETDASQHQDDLALLEKEANDLEKAISLRSKEYRQAMEAYDHTWKDVQKSLQPGEAVIEFESFRNYDKRWTDSTWYYALVLRPEYEYPKMVFLCEERTLKEMFDHTGKENRKSKVEDLYSLNRGAQPVINTTEPAYRSNAIFDLIWRPLDSLLQGVNTIWYSPSGLLHRISFPAIAVNLDQRLFDRYRLNCLSSSRSLIGRVNETFTFNDSIALFGGINYECDVSQSQGSAFTYLPGTLDEVVSVGENARQQGKKVFLHTAGDATEAAFKSLGGKHSPGIIHVATHGFFFDDPKKDYTSRMMMDFGNQLVRANEDPLLRSGLILAGGNRAWKGDTIPAGMENGILQAKEVSNMDLRNTKLVVLSACETGLGDVKGSEGVFGLQRSFKMAGVDYLLISLWQVPDEATQQLMTMFYENLFNGQPIREAFSDAQERLRKLKPEYEDPYYWAAWVLVE